jgi:hypothetical protein
MEAQSGNGGGDDADFNPGYGCGSIVSIEDNFH